jgi:hypothetical protein
MDRPLIDLAAGRDQDDRAALLAAFCRLQNRSNRRNVTNLHVRELLTYVLATDRDGRGVQKSYPELAQILCCTEATARSAVARAANEFGLLEVIEDRHARGGQTANRYAINWQFVRAINGGAQIPTSEPVQTTPRNRLLQYAGACCETQGPVATQQGPVVAQQPYKECTLTKPKLNPTPPLTPTTAVTDGWQVVASELELLGMQPGGIAAALQRAQARGLSPEEVQALAARYREFAKSNPAATPGWLNRWITGRSDPPPLVAPAKPVATGRGDALTREQREANALRYSIVRNGRRAGASEDEIERRLRAAGV